MEEEEDEEVHVDDDEGDQRDRRVIEDEFLNKISSPPMTPKPSPSLTTKPPSIFSVSSILADKKTTQTTQRRRAGGAQGRYSVLP